VLFRKDTILNANYQEKSVVSCQESVVSYQLPVSKLLSSIY